MPTVRIEAADGQTHELETSPAYSLLIALQRAGVAHRHDCGGKALCGTCRVRVLAGRLSPMGERERLRLQAVGESLDGTVRLACQARPGGALRLKAILGLQGERS
ncbi:MAG TPA: ferredoxin [Spirochaetaceae bacterium]|jgi:ferredoxin|nr:ferredoxin [Spirochaetaceae bacterium]